MKKVKTLTDYMSWETRRKSVKTLTDYIFWKTWRMARHNEQFQVKSKKKVYLQVLVSNKVGKELSRIKSDFRKALAKPGEEKYWNRLLCDKTHYECGEN